MIVAIGLRSDMLWPMLPSGLTLFASQPPRTDRTGGLWEIIDVSYGHSTDWTLTARLEDEANSTEIRFPHIVSFRAHDEREMLDLWATRAKEGVGVGTIYVVADSPYRTELSEAGATGMCEPLTHYVIAGTNLCVEVLATVPPLIN